MYKVQNISHTLPHRLHNSYYVNCLAVMDSLFWCTPMIWLDLTMVELLWIVCSGVPHEFARSRYGGVAISGVPP